MALRSPSWARIAHGRPQNGTGCKHGLLSINLRVDMHAEDIHQVVRILKREVQRWPVPALAKYVETPFTVLISRQNGDVPETEAPTQVLDRLQRPSCGLRSESLQTHQPSLFDVQG